MTIKRKINGETLEFCLTATELRDAWQEQQHDYDKEDVISALEEMYDPDELDLTDETIDEIAWKSREYQDEDDNISESMWNRVRDAISAVVGESEEGSDD